MKRVFFVFLFALTALVFAGCSSSGDSKGGGNGGGGGQSPKDFSGKVIIPSAYVGYDLKVCADANNSNSCGEGETLATLATDGSFSITTIPTTPLVAEFYAPSSTTGINLFSDALPALVYTTPAIGDIPAESVTLSAFTTMVKSKMDSSPLIYDNAEKASGAVRAETDIPFNPFESDDYAANIDLHNAVSALVADILDTIHNTLGSKSIELSFGVISALYTAVFDVVSEIVKNPGYDYETDKSDIKSKLDEEAITAVNTPTDFTKWDLTQSKELYLVEGSRDKIMVTPVKIEGNHIYVYKSERKELSLTNNGDSLPQHSGEPENNQISVKKAVKASPKNITATPRFDDKPFTLSGNATVYTLLFTQNPTPVTNPGDLHDWSGTGGHPLGNNAMYICPLDGVSSIDLDNGMNFVSKNGAHRVNISSNKDFTWAYNSNVDTDPFGQSSSFQKKGTVSKVTGDEGLIKLTADDNSVIYLFTYQGASWGSIYYANVDATFTFFDAEAAKSVIQQAGGWAPLW
jgi:hypothetical protein